jgi:hypothetical protein
VTRIKTLTKPEWEKEGAALFGPDPLQWRFICPVCKNIQCPEDFRQHKGQGAGPDSAYCECIGRYLPGSRSAMRDREGQPCDYALYGLFQLYETEVETEDGKLIPVFEFYKEDNDEQKLLRDNTQRI